MAKGMTALAIYEIGRPRHEPRLTSLLSLLRNGRAVDSVFPQDETRHMGGW
eukprot:CAMPEP_0172483918 /NCGR_PEP_ID=MMETSP1066-20121228/11147_1 /TAXON_ID=671091 /ORGANISM="Coscinodiscus wailesii, Strain CCMP2513" /LENGTH=50 /DNA_ID=CAMNT_0013248105 /DNA_START=59 /DNA_END=211 /DNA_ORIENTATION=-